MVRRNPLRVSEHGEQMTVIQWARAMSGSYPELEWLHAIPNGSKLPYHRDRNGNVVSNQGQRMKAEGLTRGIFDLFLPCPTVNYHGLYIEMKIKPNKLSPEQIAFEAYGKSAHYKMVVAWSAEEAIDALKDYLGVVMV
jgi:hypothetical protein